jgi:hypothetical protein
MDTKNSFNDLRKSASFDSCQQGRRRTMFSATSHTTHVTSKRFRGRLLPVAFLAVFILVFAFSGTAIADWQLNFIAGSNGSLVGGDESMTNTNGTPYAGGKQALADANYHFVEWTNTCVTVNGAPGLCNPYTPTAPTPDNPYPGTPVIDDSVWNITATFAIDTYDVAFVSGGNGTLTGNTLQTIDHGGSTVAVTTVDPDDNPDYHFVNWTVVGGGAGETYSGPLTDENLTLSNVQSDMTLTANFAIDTHTVGFAVGANGVNITGTNPQTADDMGATTGGAVTANPVADGDGGALGLRIGQLVNNGRWRWF